MILDGGPCTVGVESTIINLASEEPELLRYGAVTREMLEEALGRPVVNPKPSSPKVSGQLKSHYAPVTPVTLADEDAIPEIAASLAPETCAVLAPESILARCPANAVFRLQSAESEPEYAALLVLQACDAACAAMPPFTGPTVEVIVSTLDFVEYEDDEAWLNAVRTALYRAAG